MSLLEIRDLAVSYRTRGAPVRAVDGVSLRVGAGEIVAVVGESGSGKSTTAHAVVRLLAANARITDGSIVFEGEHLEQASPRTLRAVRGARIGLVPQDPAVSLNPVKRIGEQVAEVLRLHGRAGRREAAVRAIETLERAGLPDAPVRARQYPHELSGGMRQRVLIAITIAADPRLIIADEPTSALDVTVQKRILDHLQQLVADSGTAVLLVTHDLAVAADRADRLVVMSKGTVVETGPTRTVMSSPQHDYTRQLLAANPATLLSTVNPAAPRTSTNPVTLLAPADPVALRTSASPADVPAPADSASARGSSPVRGRVGAIVPARDRAEASQLSSPYTGGGAPGPRERPQNLLEVKDLTKVFPLPAGGRVRAVDSVSFTVRRGETLALVGESGSGKSTTGRLVLRLVDATSGTVRFDGDDITGSGHAATRQLRRRAQLVYQNPYASLDPRFTVAEIVEEPLRVFRVGDRASRRARARDLLERVALPSSLIGRRPAELSGGQRQRVAVARALALSPDLVVWDEPVSALDVSVQAQVLELLERLQAETGVAYLFISHDLAVVRRLAHRVAVMRHGRIVEISDTIDIFSEPRHEYTRELLAAVPGRNLTDEGARP